MIGFVEEYDRTGVFHADFAVSILLGKWQCHKLRAEFAPTDSTVHRATFDWQARKDLEKAFHDFRHNHQPDFDVGSVYPPGDEPCWKFTCERIGSKSRRLVVKAPYRTQIASADEIATWGDYLKCYRPFDSRVRYVIYRFGTAQFPDMPHGCQAVVNVRDTDNLPMGHAVLLSKHCALDRGLIQEATVADNGALSLTSSEHEWLPVSLDKVIVYPKPRLVVRSPANSLHNFFEHSLPPEMMFDIPTAIEDLVVSICLNGLTGVMVIPVLSSEMNPPSRLGHP